MDSGLTLTQRGVWFGSRCCWVSCCAFVLRKTALTSLRARHRWPIMAVLRCVLPGICVHHAVACGGFVGVGLTGISLQSLRVDGYGGRFGYAVWLPFFCAVAVAWRTRWRSVSLLRSFYSGRSHHDRPYYPCPMIWGGSSLRDADGAVMTSTMGRVSTGSAAFSQRNRRGDSELVRATGGSVGFLRPCSAASINGRELCHRSFRRIDGPAGVFVLFRQQKRGRSLSPRRAGHPLQVPVPIHRSGV